MSSTEHAILTEDQIDDLLYFARAGELSDFQTTLNELSSSIPAPAATILAGAIDERSGNTVLHMAAANGHDGILSHVLQILSAASKDASSISPSPQPGTADGATSRPPLDASSTSEAPAPRSVIDHPNASGSTALHWAALNGHVTSVRLLADGGADLNVENAAKHDALDEAERAERRDVARFLMARMSGKTEAEIEELERKREDEEKGGSGETAGDAGGVKATQRDLERLGLGEAEEEEEEDSGGVKIGGGV